MTNFMKLMLLMKELSNLKETDSVELVSVEGKQFILQELKNGDKLLITLPPEECKECRLILN